MHQGDLVEGGWGCVYGLGRGSRYPVQEREPPGFLRVAGI
jgi:hypothetical protein